MVPHAYRDGFSVLVVTVIMGLGAPNLAVAGNCPEVALVIPPSLDGGTIFVKQRNNRRYQRAGYLQRGTVLRVKDTIRIGTPSDPFGPKKTYVRFVSSTGLSGFVDQAATTTLHDLIDKFGDDSSVLYDECELIKAVVVPVNPQEDVHVYYRLENANAESPAFTFSRSTHGLVVLRDYPPVVEEAEDGTEYFTVWFLQEETSPPRVLWKQGFLRVSKLDNPGRPGIYRFGLLSGNFTPLRETLECSSGTECGYSIVAEFMEVAIKKSIPDRVRDIADKLLAKKTCRSSFDLTSEGGLGGNFLFIRGGVGVQLSVKLPEGERYGIRSFHELGSAFYTQACNGGNAPVGVRRITSQFELDGNPRVSIDSSTLSEHITGCFVLAERLGPNSSHEGHMVVALNASGANPRYFAAFTDLDRFFRGLVFEELGLDRDKQLLQDRVVAYLHHLLVGWQSNNRPMPPGFRAQCGTRVN